MGSIEKALEGVSLEGVQELDALIVGAGFGGVYQLKRLRDEGFNVKLVEAGDSFGGVWYWNRYPGARVDSTIPHYEFDDPEVWKNWEWKQRFPDHEELRSYFTFLDSKWNLSKDAIFETFVQSASWDDNESKWTIKTKNGKTFKAKYFLLNVGFAAKRYIPDWKGIDNFKGTFIHPSYWPHEEPDLAGKKIAVIGTGSTGIQIAHELSKTAGSLTVFQRSINTSMPMKQVNYVPGGEQAIPREDYPANFANRVNSYGGFNFSFLPRNTFDDTPEERLKTYEALWAEGDFKYWLATYQDTLFNQAANEEAYRFWRDKVRARIHGERERDILAPMKQPYAFGCKRISLENGYFEIFNQDNVHLVDVNATPVECVTEKGIKTSEKEWEFDYIICATGYDAVTGGIAQIDIKNAKGDTLKDYWKDGAKTYLGMSVASFPNMFFTYGPQAPTALCNGPTCAQLQGDWVVSAMNYMKEKNLKKMIPEGDAEKGWRELVMNIANSSLLPTTKSWYMGDNIPGKPREPLIFLGGVPTYNKMLQDSATNDYKGFKLE